MNKVRGSLNDYTEKLYTTPLLKNSSRFGLGTQISFRFSLNTLKEVKLLDTYRDN
jgi:hypothetical protein